MAIAFVIGSALAAFLLAWIACGLTMRLNVLDAPDGARKQQAAPVPRLGGIGVLATIIILYGMAALAHEALPGAIGHDWLPGPIKLVLLALAGGLALGLIGVADDVFGLTSLVKLVLVAGVCIAAPLFGVRVAAFETPFGGTDLAAITILGSALWLLVFTNAANFMDGSNGLSLGSMGIMFAGLGGAYAVSADAAFPTGLAVIMGAIGGFLIHNMRGKLYAGDGGAFGLGGLFAMLALVAGLPVWTAATLALPFLVDVLLTLILRARNGEPWLVAHADHAYQALIKAGWSHWEAAVSWWALSAACAVGAVIAVSGGGALPFAVFVFFLAILCALWVAAKRQPLKQVTGGLDR